MPHARRCSTRAAAPHTRPPTGLTPIPGGSALQVIPRGVGPPARSAVRSYSPAYTEGHGYGRRAEVGVGSFSRPGSHLQCGSSAPPPRRPPAGLSIPTRDEGRPGAVYADLVRPPPHARLGLWGHRPGVVGAGDGRYAGRYVGARDAQQFSTRGASFGRHPPSERGRQELGMELWAA